MNKHAKTSFGKPLAITGRWPERQIKCGVSIFHFRSPSGVDLMAIRQRDDTLFRPRFSADVSFERGDVTTRFELSNDLEDAPSYFDQNSQFQHLQCHTSMSIEVMN
jgi:hypothetical protein